MKELIIAGKKFHSRFFLGTGKFASKQQLAAALEASGTELVTTALTRVDLAAPGTDDILSAIAASALAYDESGAPFELSKEMFALSADPAPATGKYTLTIDDEWYKGWKEGSRYYEFVFANGGESATITIV